MTKHSAKTKRGSRGGKGPVVGDQALATRRPRADYMRGNRGAVMTGWRPALREPAEYVRLAYPEAQARTNEIMQNVGWIAGAIDQAVADTVGLGLRLNAKPDAAALGLTDEGANEWANGVESRFVLWARKPMECDAEGRRNFGQLQAAAFRSYIGSGEIVSELPWIERGGCYYGTKMRLLPAQRLSQKTDTFTRLFQGVRMDRDGLPISYVFEIPDPILGKREVELPARDVAGRPRVLHIYDGHIGHVRGLSPLVPVLQVARQYDQLADATLMAAIIHAVFAATIESSVPTEQVLEAFQTPGEQARSAAHGTAKIDSMIEAHQGWYENVHFDLGINGRMAHMFPGEKLEFKSSESPNATYKEFALHLLRECARGLGVTYEGMTGDYAGVTFSSVRMATDSNFRIVKYRRDNLIAPFCQAGYEAWLEEEIERGGIKLDGGLDRFMEYRSGICNAEWRGSPKPQADDSKVADAYATLLGLRVISESYIADDFLGLDLEDVYAELGRAKKLRKKYDVDEPVISKTQAGKSANANSEADTPQ